MKIEQLNTPVIAFGSGKGGSGKTTIIANIAYALSEIGEKVLLIDADFSTRGLSFFISKGLTKLNAENCLLEYLDSSVPLDMVSPINVTNNIHLIPATKDIEESVFSNINKLDEYTKSLNLLLEYYINDYSAILIDTQSGTDWKSIFPCTLADIFILVTEEDRTSFRVTSVINNLIKDHSKKHSQKGLFILNRCVEKQSEEVISFLETRFLQNEHLSTFLYDPKVKLAFLLDNFVLEKYPESEFSIQICDVIDFIFKKSDSIKYEYIRQKISTLRSEFSGVKDVKGLSSFIRFESIILILFYLTIVLISISSYSNIPQNIYNILLTVLLTLLGIMFFTFSRKYVTKK